MAEASVPCAAYRYQPFTKIGTFRLLKLEHGEHPATPLQGSLISTELDCAPDFEALSYSWGDRLADDPMIILDWQSLKVTKNRYSALLRLRQRRKPIWIDAICINQQDTDERTQQVRQMQVIYGRASLVIIWLGEPSEEDIQGLNFANALIHAFGGFVAELKAGKSPAVSPTIEIDTEDIAIYASRFGQEFYDSVQQHYCRISRTLHGVSRFVPGGLIFYCTLFAKDWFHRTWGKLRLLSPSKQLIKVHPTV